MEVELKGLYFSIIFLHSSKRDICNQETTIQKRKFLLVSQKKKKKGLNAVEEEESKSYNSFQNDRHFSIILFPCKLALMASLSNVKFKRIFNLERGHEGQFAWKQKNTKMAAILE